MKKLIVLAIFVSGFTAVHAQKYITRTGKVTFFSNTAIEKIEAFNNEVANILDSKTGDIIFQMPIKSFKFEKELMAEHFNEDYMESDKFPKSDFKGKVTNISEVNFSKDGTYNVKAEGKLTIHGVTQTVSINGTMTVKGKDVTVNSKFMIKTKDYGIKIPSVVEGKIAKEIEITVNSVLSTH